MEQPNCRRNEVDKKRVGAVVGVIGVAGALAATQFIDINTSKAEYMTKNLADQYNATLAATKSDDEKEAEVAEAQPSVGNSGETKSVYDAQQKVEYVLSAPLKSEAEPQEAESSSSSSEEVISEAESEAELSENSGEATATQNQVAEVAPSDEELDAPQQAQTRSAEDEDQAGETESRAFVGLVVPDVLNVRVDATMDADVVTVLLHNEVVRGTTAGDWIAVQDENGTVGYVSRTFVEETTEEAAQEQEAINRQEAEQKRQEEQKKADEKAEQERIEAEKQAEQAKQEEESQSGELSGYINADAVNVRADARQDASILGTLHANDAVSGTVKNGWVAIDYHGHTAYVSAALVGSDKIEVSAEKTPNTVAAQRAAEEAARESARSGYVKTVSNVRKGPGENYGIVTTLGVNTYVEGAESNGWVRFELDGETVYIAEYLLVDEKIDVPEPKANTQQASDQEGVDGDYSSISSFAEAQVGKPYVFAASGPGAFDCSGLTMAAYARMGVSLPHSAERQANYGYAVSMDQLQPGDMLFYTTDGTGEISHVGIYVGNGQMVHASSPGVGVIYSDIYSDYYMTNFITARRIFN